MLSKKSAWLLISLLLGLVHFNQASSKDLCFCKLSCKNNSSGIESPLYTNTAGIGWPLGTDQSCADACATDINQYVAASLNGLTSKACTTCGPNSTLIGYHNSPMTVPSDITHIDTPIGYGGSTTQASQSCKCPAGWLANNTNVDGGITYAGNYACKKSAAPCLISVKPLPPVGTAISGGAGNPDWGFIWVDGIYAWGSAANGGQAICSSVPCKINWTGLPVTCTGPNC